MLAIKNCKKEPKHTFMLRQSTRIIYTITLSILIIFSCKKETGINEEEKLLEQADYNNKITAGVGNIFYQKNISPNNPFQLLMKMVFKNDTVYYFGKTNASRKVQYFHTIVISKQTTKELYVTEIYPDSSSLRMYTIKDGQKSRFLIESFRYGKEDGVISLIDRNGSTGELKVLSSSSVKNNQVVAQYNARLNNYSVCPEAPPTDDLMEDNDKHQESVLCQLWDYLPENAKDLINKAAQLNSISLTDFEQLLRNINGTYDYKNSTAPNYTTNNYQSTLSDLYYHPDFTSQLKEERKKAEAELDESPVSIKVDQTKSTLNFDEIRDNIISLYLIVIDKATALPYTKKPLFIRVKWLDPISGNYIKTNDYNTDIKDGTVAFGLNPINYPHYKNLKAIITIPSRGETETWTQDFTLKFIVPKVIFYDGSDLPSLVKFENGKPLSFRLVNEDNREIPHLDYNDIVAGSFSNTAKISSKFEAVPYVLSGNSQPHFKLTLSTNETTDQLTSFDVLHKSSKVQTLNASVTGNLTDFYKSIIPGQWTIREDYSGGFWRVWKYIVNADGTAQCISFEDPTRSVGIDASVRSWTLSNSYPHQFSLDGHKPVVLSQALNEQDNNCFSGSNCVRVVRKG